MSTMSKTISSLRRSHGTGSVVLTTSSSHSLPSPQCNPSSNNAVQTPPQLQLLAHLSPTATFRVRHTAMWHLSSTQRLLQIRANVILLFRHTPNNALSNPTLVLPVHTHTTISARSDHNPAVSVDAHTFTFLSLDAAAAFQAVIRAEAASHCPIHRSSEPHSVNCITISKADAYFSPRATSALINQHMFLRASSQLPFSVLPYLQRAYQTPHSFTFELDSFDYAAPLPLVLAQLPDRRIPLQAAKALFVEMVLSLLDVHSLGFLLRDVSPDAFAISKTGHIRLNRFNLVKHALSSHVLSAEPDLPSSSSVSTCTDHSTPSLSDPEIFPCLFDQQVLQGDFTEMHISDVSLEDNTDCFTFKYERSPNPNLHRTKSFVGPRSHMSPEHLSAGYAGKGSYGTAADVWMLGVTLYTMVVGRHPFQQSLHDAGLLFKAIRSKEVHVPQGISPELAHVLRGMLQKDELKRMDLSQVMASSWLQDISWSQVRNEASQNSYSTVVVDLLQNVRLPQSPIGSDVSTDSAEASGAARFSSRNSSLENGSCEKRRQMKKTGRPSRYAHLLGFDYVPSRWVHFHFHVFSKGVFTMNYCNFQSERSCQSHMTAHAI